MEFYDEKIVIQREYKEMEKRKMKDEALKLGGVGETQESHIEMTEDKDSEKGSSITIPRVSGNRKKETKSKETDKKKVVDNKKQRLPKWDDEKLIEYVSMYNGSKDDKEFIREYYGYTKGTADNYYYRAKNEIRFRNLKLPEIIESK